MSIGFSVNNTNDEGDIANKDCAADNNDYKISKSMLLNWLASSDEEISVVELGNLIESKTKGEYSLVKKGEKPDTKMIIKI
jgi:hypothetical protein